MLEDEAYEKHSMSWEDVRRMTRKYWRLVLAVTVSGVLGTYLSLQFFFTNQYQTKAALLVKVGRENTELPASVLNGQVLNQGVQIADINSEVQMLGSRVLVEKVVDELGPEKFKFEMKRPRSIFGYPKYAVKSLGRLLKGACREALILAHVKQRLNTRELAILGVEKGVTVEPVKESDVLVLKVQLPDAVLCVDVANRLLAGYLDERARVRYVSAGGEVFKQQVIENRERLKALVDRRAKLRLKWHLSSADQQRGLLLQELSTLRLQSIRNQSEITQLEKQEVVMKSQLTTLPEMLPKEKVEARNPALQSMQERLTALQVEHAKLASRYQPDSETMKRIDAEIAELQGALEREAPSVAASSVSEVNPVVRDYKTGLEQNRVRIAGLTSQNKDLADAAARTAADLNRINEGGDAYDTLDREYRIAERTYLEYAKRQEDARMSAELDTRSLPNVVVMTRPETPIEPVFPRKLFTLMFAIPLSLLLGIALAALLEAMDDRIRDAQSLAGLEGVMFLGAWKPARGTAGGEHGGE